MRNTTKTLSVRFGLLLSALLPGTAALAQLPAAQLDSIFPLGAAANSTVELVIGGADLDDVDRVQFSHAGITAKQKMAEPTPFDEGPQPVDNTFIVTVAADVPPGKHEVRCRGKYGLSNPRSFVVGRLAEQPEIEPNNSQDTATPVMAPVVLNGQSAAAGDVDWYEVSGQPGLQLLIDSYALQLDSLMQPVLAACDESGLILCEARSGAGSEPILDVKVPPSGKLLLKVHDAQYRQGSSYGYRIVINARPHIDFVFPPAAVADTSSSFTVYGRHLPAGQPTDLKIDGYAVRKQEVQIAAPADATGQLNFTGYIEPHLAGLDAFEYRIGSGNQVSNPVLVSLAAAPVVREEPDNDQPQSAQKISLPCDLAGQFYPQRDIDWFTFDAHKDDTFAFELYSHRLGLPTDPALLLQQVTTKDDGTEQVRDIVFVDDVPIPNNRNESGRHEFDTSSSDPSYLFSAPADGTYRVLVRDGYSSLHNDPRLVYRLVIRRPQPDYRLVAVPGDSLQSLMLRREGREVVRVFAVRKDGFDGDIHVKTEGLPAGVSCDEIAIGPSNSIGTLVLTASGQAQPATASLKITGTATIDGQPVSRNARFGAVSMPYRMSTPNNRLPSVRARITSDIQLCVTDEEPAPALLTIGDGKPLDAARGTSLKLKYKLAKRNGIGGTMTGYPMNFPANTTAGTVNIGAKKEGDFELRFNSTAVPGTYSIYLAGYLQNMPYKRNPESVAPAKQRQTRVAKIQEDAAKASRDADQAVRDRQNDLTKANATLSTAKSAKQTADKSLTSVTSQLTAAQKARDERQKQSAAAPDDESLAKQLAAAEKALADATEKLQQAKKDADKAGELLTETTAAQQAATTAKTAADKAAVDAKSFLQEAQREKQRVDQFVRARETAARQRNVNVVVPSNTLTIRLAAYPIELADLPADLTVQQGEKLEIPLQLTRLHSFKGNISVQLQMPGGVSGISIPNLNIAADKTDGKLLVTTQAAATAGRHTINLRLTMNANGNLVMERPLVINVTEAPQKEK